MWRSLPISTMQRRKWDAAKVFMLVIGLPLGLVIAWSALAQ